MRLFITGIMSFVSVSLTATASAHPRPPIASYVSVRPIGAEVEVRWSGGQWMQAQVLATRGDDYFVHYVGRPSSWDEWVDDAHVRPVPIRVAPVESSWVYWSGDWHSGRVIERRSGWYRVRYEAWGRPYDGWVEADRYRAGRRPSRAERPIPMYGRPRPTHDRYDGDVYDQPVRPQPAYEPDRPVRPEPADPEPARPHPADHGQPERPQGGSPAPTTPPQPTPPPAPPSGGVRPTGEPNHPGGGNTTPPPNQGGHATHPGGSNPAPHGGPATRPTTDDGGQATRPTH